MLKKLGTICVSHKKNEKIIQFYTKVLQIKNVFEVFREKNCFFKVKVKIRSKFESFLLAKFSWTEWN